MDKILLFIALILPWFSLFFVHKATIKRFMPVTVLCALMMTIVFEIAYTFKWWVIHSYIVPWGKMIDISFAYGLFTVGTFWIFVLTYRFFPVFILTNIVMDAFMAFGALKILHVLGIASLENIKSWQYFLVMFCLSFLLYGYHKWQEGIFKDT